MFEQMFDGIGIFVPVSDLEISAHWYRDNLGLQINGWDKPEAAVLGGGDGCITFCLVKCEHFVPQPFPKNNYEVEVYYNFHTRDVDGLHQNLSERGVRVTEIRELGKHRFFSFFDPDGNKYGAVNSK